MLHRCIILTDNKNKTLITATYCKTKTTIIGISNHLSLPEKIDILVIKRYSTVWQCVLQKRSMDADSSYGGSDTAQDSTLGHDNNSLETSNTHDEVDKSVMSSSEGNTYFKNEVTLPINYKEGEEKTSLPHYLSTAKLNIEESVDNNHQLDELSKNYSSTHNLNAESPKSRRSAGIDNPAYEEDGKVHAPSSNGALKSTFDENKTYTNGDLNTSPTLAFSSPNKGEEQMAEAVNLELINLKPVGKDVVGGYGGTNGINDIPIKKETEVEIGNPYDEYFVPVNEHRKYMRGEKLYVTKDKRDKKKRNKCLCWSICLVFVAAAVIVGILAAVGIIGNQEAQPVQGARQFSDTPETEKTKTKSAGGLFGVADTPEESPPPSSSSYPPTPQPAIITMGNLPPTTDTSRIEVPRALESQVIIDNLEFSDELAHKNSSEFRNLAESVEKQLMRALFSEDEIASGKAKIQLKVMEFMPGSVVVKYRISWIFTDENDATDPVDKESLNRKLTNTLNRNFGYLDEYHIPESTIATEKIINMCQIDNNGCEHTCSFDYENNDFKCECPFNMQLNTNEKTCVNIPLPEPSSSTEAESMTDFEFEPSHVHHHGQGRSNDADIYTEPEPWPTTRPTETHIYTTSPKHDMVEHEPDENHTPKPEPEPEPSTQYHLDTHTQTIPHEYGITIKPEPEPEPSTQRHLEAYTHTVPQEHGISAEPEPTVKPEPEPSTTHHWETYTRIISHDHGISAQPETTVKPESEPEPSTPHHIGISADPEPEPEPTTHHRLEDYTHTVPHDHDISAEPETTIIPQLGPESSTQHHLHSASADAEPTVKPEPEPEPTTRHHVDDHTHTIPHDHGISAEPESTIKPEPEPEPVSTTQHHMHSVSADAEPTVKPEPNVNDDSELHAYHTLKTELEHTMLPPTSQAPNTEHMHDHQNTEAHPETEPTQPTVKPEPEPTTHSNVPSHVHEIDHVSEHKTEPNVREEQHIPVYMISEHEPTEKHEPDSTSHQYEIYVTRDTTVKPDESESHTSKSEDHNSSHESKMDLEHGVGHIYLDNTSSSTSERSTISDQPKPVIPVEPDLDQPEAETDISTISKTSSPSTTSLNDEVIDSVQQTTDRHTQPVEQVTESSLQHNANQAQLTTTSPEPTIATVEGTTPTIKSADDMNSTPKDMSKLHLSEIAPEGTTDFTMTTTMKIESNTTQRVREETTIIPDVIDSKSTTTHVSPISENMQMSNEEVSSTKMDDGNMRNAMTREGKLSDVSLETTTHAMTTLKQNDADSKSVMLDMKTMPGKYDSMEQEANDTSQPLTHSNGGNVMETTTERVTESYVFIPVAIVNHAHSASTEHTSNGSTTERVMDMFSSDSTEVAHNYDNMSPFLPDIENDTLINNLHSDVDGFTEPSYHVKETEMYMSSENPPRMDKDEMNETNPRDRYPVDAVLSVLPLDDNDTVNSNEIVNKIESLPTKQIKIENKTETVIPEATTKTVVKHKEVTLSPDIINNVHSNNYFLRLQTSTEAEHSTEPIPRKEASESITENNISTEDLIAQETTTNKLQEINNATTVLVETLPPATEKVYVIDDRMANDFEIMPTTQTHMDNVSTEAHQYEVHENLSEDVTTIRNIIRLSTTEATTPSLLQVSNSPLPVIPLSEEELNSKEEKRGDLRSVENIYDPRELLNDIADEDKFILSEKKEKSNDDAMATDRTIVTSSTFHKEVVDEADHFYLQNIKNATTASDVKPVTEGFTISHFSRCSSGQFQCANGTSIIGSTYCISENDRCDSVDDCTDASDEIGCAEEQCLQNFQCQNGQCLKRMLVCNGISDCTDGSDELNCESWKCRFDEFSCGESNRCIPLSMRCDGRKDCPKGDDEHSCYSQPCKNDEYSCNNKDTCIPASWRCDGEKDCMEGDDENLCECAFDQFKCVTGGGCIAKDQICDGLEQCADSSDEWDCIRLHENMEQANYLEARHNMTWLQVCSSHWNSSFSDMACQSLGFAGSASTEFIKLKENATLDAYYKLKESQFDASLLAWLEKTDDCDSVVSLTCLDYECGSKTSSDVPSARIIGGNRASETQWPGVVLLYNKKHHIYCTSTVIAPSWVLASFSCMFSAKYLPGDADGWTLYSGGTNFSATMHSSAQLRSVRRIIPHPQAKYSEIVYSNDIVLVQLDMPLHLGPNISAICLPNAEIEPRQLCVTAGWGVKTPGESNRQEYLHYLPVPTLETAQCNSSAHYNGRLTTDKICAGYTDSDRTPCYNDEGAPLMCFSEISNTWELQGLLSNHANCGRNRHPALYTSINHDIRGWITNTTGIRLTMNERAASN
ncbi:uncharacterized protein LOC116172030 isoform X2 [Photinus pyralis]|uniref:uncharacterized protein LOC116172030 isoform X2 n=1 Tax=Photinus pyralis TaxID=7054 RepID=UPI001266EBA9|nr:uncharacterized protein LOC116172030 isoform X2 [Photinus pyralis]